MRKTVLSFSFKLLLAVLYAACCCVRSSL